MNNPKRSSMAVRPTGFASSSWRRSRSSRALGAESKPSSPWAWEAPSPAARHHATAAGSAAGAAKSATSAGTLSLLKWVVIGAVGGLTTLGAVQVVLHPPRIETESIVLHGTGANRFPSFGHERTRGAGRRCSADDDRWKSLSHNVGAGIALPTRPGHQRQRTRAAPTDYVGGRFSPDAGRSVENRSGEECARERRPACNAYRARCV